MGSRTFAEWTAYAGIEPFGELQADYRSGLTATILSNVYRRKGSRAVEMVDLFPWLETERPQKTEKELYEEFRMWAVMNR